MSRRSIGIVVNGVTGRMGYRQHLLRSSLAIRDQGGLPAADGTRIWPEPVLVGRSEARLAAIAERHGLTNWTTDLGAALSRDDVQIYFDAQVTQQREKAIRAAIEAGRHVYTEKPLAEDLASAMDLVRLARAAGIRHGVVADKLFLPGIRKLKRLVEGGFFGRILSVRGEFGYWVFEGGWQPAQRPSWNYRAADGGGIVMDMFPHWEYVLEQLFAPVRAVQCVAATHIPTRVDEAGEPYTATAHDAAYAIFELDGGIVAQVNSSWAVRVYRDELVEFQVDGTHGSAVAGLRECRIQHRATTPKPVWNPDLPADEEFRSQWQRVPDNEEFDNGFKVQWEAFLRHVADGTPFPWDFVAAARGVRPAQLKDRLRRRACGRPSGRRERTEGAGRPGLGRHPGVPAASVASRARRRRGDGHRPAGHGAGLRRDPRADPALGRTGAGRGRTDRRRGRDRSPGTRLSHARRAQRSVRLPARRRGRRRRPAGHHVQPPARRDRPLRRGLPIRLQWTVRPGAGPGRAALAGRDVRPVPRRVLGIVRCGRRRRDPAHARQELRPGHRRRQGVAPQRGVRGVVTPPPAGGGTPLHRRRLQLPAADPGRRARPLRRAAGHLRRHRTGRRGGPAGARRRRPGVLRPDPRADRAAVPPHLLRAHLLLQDRDRLPRLAGRASGPLHHGQWAARGPVGDPLRDAEGRRHPKAARSERTRRPSE